MTKVAGSAIKYKMNSDENLKIFEIKESKLLSNKVFLNKDSKCLKLK